MYFLFIVPIIMVTFRYLWLEYINSAEYHSYIFILLYLSFRKS